MYSLPQEEQNFKMLSPEEIAKEDCKRALSTARSEQRTVRFTTNGVQLETYPEDKLPVLWKTYETRLADRIAKDIRPVIKAIAEPLWTFEQCAEAAIILAAQHHAIIEFDWHDVPVRAYAEDTVEDVQNRFRLSAIKAAVQNDYQSP
jgi:hypothetical protein